MADKTAKPSPPGGPSSGNGSATDTTVSQRVLSSDALALESTQRMQRRLQQESDKQLGRRLSPPGAPISSSSNTPAPSPPRTPAPSSVQPPRRDAAVRTQRPAQNSPAPVPAQSQSPAKGQIKHDSRGNAVWNWAASVGAAALESTSRLLKRLEVPELSIEDKPKELELEERKAGGGYDPYNQEKRGRR
jgi:hypothetical protein